MNTINNNKKKVNTWEEINQLIEVEEKEALKAVEVKRLARLKELEIQRAYPDFFALVPECQLSHVLHKIKNQFAGNAQTYINSRDLFMLRFTKKMKHICDETIDRKDDDSRKKNKLRKDYLLYSSQLLGLVGKGGAKYINASLLNIYKKEQEEQDRFLLSYRLINGKGKISKLTDLETKKRVQLARILNISDTLSKKAKDRGFEYSLITLTLPPVFHGNAKIGSSASYAGWLPSKGQQQLEKFWQDIRANWARAGLKAGEHYFGCSVFEAHESSIGHKHILVYHSKEDKSAIDAVVRGVEQRARLQYSSKLNFDISNYDEKKGGAGAAYIFKYITKTCGTIASADDVTLKNMAVRWYYSARAFNFFGIKQATTKFNFLCENYKNYEEAFNSEIKSMFENYDYYSFIEKYEQYFEVVRDDDSKIKFVTFDFAGNLKEPQKKDFLRNKLIIEKKIFTVFEVNASTEEMADIQSLVRDLDTENAFSAWEYAKKLDEEYNAEVQAFISSSAVKVFRFDANYHAVMSNYYDEISKRIFSFFNDEVTVKENLSSADPSASSENPKNDVYSPRLSEKVNQKIKNLIDERRKSKGLVAQA
ncbi:replication endonuclease [Burkholderia gladioli]|uniref:replication endonuclease n=1 Tax=Burkholderia gladioli TaxID=28095 RepID=UPI002857778C|nr:replication endonuclease [Burkholderia gladioli]MDR8090600.1 replication endonuclease [Burkholderia gladioli]